MKRIVIAGLLVTSVLVPAVATWAAPARADVGAVSLPAEVTISSRTLTFTGTVRVGATTTGLRSASLWFRYPGSTEPAQVGSATSRRPGFLVVTAGLDASRVTPGPNQIEVRDDVDGTARMITMDLRRQSRVTITRAEFRSDGRVSLAVRVSHYDAKRGRFSPSKLSPVRLQEKVAGTWVPVGQAVTDTTGRAGALVKSGTGTHDYRVVRPDGRTVLAATSKTMRADRALGTTTILD